MNAIVNASVKSYGGVLVAEMALKPMREQLTFDLKLELKDADMVQLNPYFRTFANIGVNALTLGLYVEMNAEQGAFKGYMKPILKKVDILWARKILKTHSSSIYGSGELPCFFNFWRTTEPTSWLPRFNSMGGLTTRTFMLMLPLQEYCAMLLLVPSSRDSKQPLILDHFTQLQRDLSADC